MTRIRNPCRPQVRLVAVAGGGTGLKKVEQRGSMTGMALIRTVVLSCAALFSSSTAAFAQTNLCDPNWHRSANASNLQRAIRSGADVNQSCQSGSSPLLLALEYGRADVVLGLIRAGADLDYRDPYSSETPLRVINDRCDVGRMDRRVCSEVSRGFEARAEAHQNICDPRWWQSFYRQSQSQSTNRIQAVLRTPGLDVNYDCGRGDRPLHIALQDSLTPLTEGAYWGIATFMYADGVDLGSRNRSGRSIVDLIEIRYDRQLRGNYVNLLRRFCGDQITLEEYNRQGNQNYGYEMGVYVDMMYLWFGENYQTTNSQLNVEFFGSDNLGSRTQEELCAKYR